LFNNHHYHYYHHLDIMTAWGVMLLGLYRPSNRLLSTKLVSTVADRGCHVVSATNPSGRNIGFLDRSSYFLFQLAPRLYSRGWVDFVPGPLLLRKSGSTGNRTRASGLSLLPMRKLSLFAHDYFNHKDQRLVTPVCLMPTGIL
jgi:hypothetical protein